jgi:hypothetical protein
MKQEQKVAAVAIETPHAAMDEYSISTPFGTITLSNGGRSVQYELYSDIRQSTHNVALFKYVQTLMKQGVTRFNTDHIRIVGRDRSLSLTRGKAKLDLVYFKKDRFVECELKTSREIGLDVTHRQLVELCHHVDRLTLLVPRGRLEEATTIVGLIQLSHKITIVAYDDVDEDEEE